MLGVSLVALAALLSVAVSVWILKDHRKFVISLLKTHKVCCYGVYTDFSEVIFRHFWYLFQGLFYGDREALMDQVKEKFLDQLGGNKDVDDVLITHSCRAIFYGIIKTLLDEAKERTGEAKIIIATPSVHFGSFYRLLRGIEKSMNCTINFYEIDVKEADWTLDQSTISEDEIKKCDLILCQHLFGVPLNQDRLFEFGKKHNIPILEDCVQSGSLFGKYKGSPDADVILWSGGLDKTPSCFGAGFGYFRKTHHGAKLFKSCTELAKSYPIDSWKARFISCFNQGLHLMIAKNVLCINHLIGLLAYLTVSDKGDYVKWYAIALIVRKNKAIAPFHHAESAFLKQPSVYHLLSMLYGLSKLDDYARIAKDEIERRDLLLNNIPKEYHQQLFPFLSPQQQQDYRDNIGISEFSWVLCRPGQRLELCQFLNDHFIISLINTTWEFHEHSKLPMGKFVCENLVYLPNLNQLSKQYIPYVGEVLTKFCEHGENMKKLSVSPSNGTPTADNSMGQQPQATKKSD